MSDKTNNTEQNIEPVEPENNKQNNTSKSSTKKSFFKTRKFKYGTISTVITVCAIIVAILLNMVMQVLDTNFNLSFDLTKNNFYSMSDTTKEYISSLDQNIEIIVLDTEENFRSVDSQYYAQASSIINQYQQNSDKITVQYLPLDENPTLSVTYSQDSIQEDDVIVKAVDSGNYKVLTSNDLFDVSASYYSYSITSSKAEQAITSAILNLTSTEKTKVDFIKGYDEDDYTGLQELLENNGYEINEVNILSSNLSSDSKMAFIFGPKLDYDAESLAKLNAYMENGKDIGTTLVYIASPDAGEMPNLNSLLSYWGINVGSGIVFETDYNNLFSSTSAFYTLAQYGDTKYTDAMKKTNIYVAVPFSKPITMSTVDSVSSEELLSFSSSSGIYPIDASADWQPSEADITGPITAACLSTKSNNGVDSNVCVIGSSLAFDESIIKRSALNNSTYFATLFNDLAGKDNGIVIEAKSVEYDTVNVSTLQALLIGAVLTVIIPIALVVTGILIWLRRRRK